MAVKPAANQKVIQNGHFVVIVVVIALVLVIAGATSVGKTELSLQLAALLNGEVISADSAQV